MVYGIRFAFVITFITSCMVGDPTLPTDDEIPPPQSEAARSDNARTAWNFFKAKGLSDIQTAGIIGNLMQESSLSPTAAEPGGAGRGIAQWGVGGRFDTGSHSLTTYANAHGTSRWALTTQLDFTWYELNTLGGFGLNDLRAATTITTAVTVFQNKYELCGACAQTKRIQYAQQALANYGGTGDTSGEDPPPPPPMGGTPPPDVTCYSGTLQRDMPVNACVESMYDDLWYQCSTDGHWIDRWSDPDACNGEYPL